MTNLSDFSNIFFLSFFFKDKKTEFLLSALTLQTFGVLVGSSVSSLLLGLGRTCSGPPLSELKTAIYTEEQIQKLSKNQNVDQEICKYIIRAQEYDVLYTQRDVI